MFRVKNQREFIARQQSLGDTGQIDIVSAKAANRGQLVVNQAVVGCKTGFPAQTNKGNTVAAVSRAALVAAVLAAHFIDTAQAANGYRQMRHTRKNQL